MTDVSDEERRGATVGDFDDVRRQVRDEERRGATRNGASRTIQPGESGVPILATSGESDLVVVSRTELEAVCGQSRVEAALAEALLAASRASRWAVVVQLARELEARREGAEAELEAAAEDVG